MTWRPPRHQTTAAQTMKATQESNELLLQALAHDEYRRQPGGSRGRLMPASNRQVRAKDIATHDQRLACKGW